MTEQERTLVCKAATDLETGNHLVYPRTKEEKEMIADLNIAILTLPAERTARQKELMEEYRKCTEPDYKGSILSQVNASGKDILSFLAEKYGVSRPEVKQAIFFYAYNDALISNPDSLKFAEPNNPYQNLINDYIDYTKEFMDAKRETIRQKENP